MDHLPEGMSAEALLAHYGEDEKILHAVVPPIFQTSLFTFDTAEELMQAMVGNPAGPPDHYSRISNPSMTVAECKLAALEGTERAKVLSSGQAALTMAVMSETGQGAHVVAVDTIYGPSKQLLTSYLPRFGVSHTYVDGRTVESVIDAVQPETTLIYLESPSSIVFRLQDIAAIAKFARERGITTMIDNTWATPLLQNPALLGVDIVCHSATKYLGGHSDLVAGVLCTDAARMDRIVRNEVNLLGSALAPFPAWLLNRGMRTLPSRIARHGETGLAVAEWLEGQSGVETVLHPGLASYPQRELALRQMRGTTGLFSFVPKVQDKEKCFAFVNALRWFGKGVSWGGHESLALPLHVHPLGWDEPTWVIRCYCGMESPTELIDDLRQAFEVSGLA